MINREAKKEKERNKLGRERRSTRERKRPYIRREREEKRKGEKENILKTEKM